MNETDQTQQFLFQYNKLARVSLKYVNPSVPNINIHVPLHYSPYISYVTSRENVIDNQDISLLVIIFFIPMNCMFDQVVML